MSEKLASPIKKWQSLFEEQPLEALDRLLLGRTYMGVLNRNDANEILYRLFHTSTKSQIDVLDKALKDWFVKYWESTPPSISIQRWNETLRNAFSTVIRLNLTTTRTWLFEHYQQARVWLYGLYLGPDSDPEADLLRLIALSQTDQSLLPLWTRLCRLEEDRPLHFADIGLLGLRKLPDENGEPHSDIHPAVFNSIIDLAKAIDKQVRPKNTGKEFWLLKVREIMARYPRSSQYWVDHFFSDMVYHPGETEIKWLGKVIPGLNKKLEYLKPGKKTNRQVFRPPSRTELENILELLQKKPLKEIESQLTTFLNKHRRYAVQTGYAEFLVKTFSNIGYKILRQDPRWALSLVEEAHSWAPYNFYVWVERANIESYLGRDNRAIALLWEAKRKFPEIPDIRTNLATLLRREGKNKIVEIVYRQTIEDFPTNAVCRNGLAEVLRAQGRLDEAEAIYRQAMKDFPSNAVCRTGLAEVLRAQGRLEDAEAIYRQAMKDFPTNAVCRTGLAEVLRAQGRLEDAEAIYRQAMKDFPNDAVCRTGLAEVLRTQGRLEDAEAIYRQAMKDFPNDAVCRNGLAVILLIKGDKVQAIDLLNKTIQQFPYDPVAKGLLQKIEGKLEDETAILETLEELKQEVAETEKIIEEQEIEKTSMEDILVSDKLSEQVISELPTDGNGKYKAELGLANLYRLASRRAQGAEKEQYEQEFKKACEGILAEQPNNIYALLEQGFWLLEQNAQNAKQYFAQYSQNDNKTRVLGFRIGFILAKIQQSEQVTTEEWKELMTEFSSRKLLIAYENVSQELNQSNGKTLTILESLRKEMQKDLDALPATLRENEKWLRSSLSERLFKGINLKSSIIKSDLPKILKNHTQNSPILQGVIEQSLVNF